MVERQSKTLINIGLPSMLAVTKFTNRQTRVRGSKFRRSAVLVGSTDEEHFIALLPAEPRMDISRQQRAAGLTARCAVRNAGETATAVRKRSSPNGEDHSPSGPQPSPPGRLNPN
jgi:hypothetical protein